jgi:hypothetical protein
MDGRRSINLLYLIAAIPLVGIPLAILGWQQSQIVKPSAIGRHLDGDGKLRPEVAILDKLQTARLQAIAIDSTVTAEASDPGWRGETRAIVEVRVRYNYGIDLKGLTRERVNYIPGKKTLRVTVPQPTKSFEFPDAVPIREEVELGWLRFKKLSGNEQLLVAHKKLHAEAEHKVIPEAELKQIEQQCLESLRGLIQGFVDDSTVVHVVYGK